MRGGAELRWALSYNVHKKRGRAEFEFVCAICGKSHQESPLDETPLGATDRTEGKIALPLCEDYKADNEKPVLVGKANLKERAVEKRTAKRTAKADARKYTVRRQR